MAAPSVEARVSLKSGKQRTISYEVDSSSEGANQYKKLRENLKKLQGDVNAILTEEVEQENAVNKQSAGDSKHATTTDDSDENEDDDTINGETDETRNRRNGQGKEPPSKKHKT